MINKGFSFTSKPWYARVVLFVGDRQHLERYLQRIYHYKFTEDASDFFSGCAFRMEKSDYIEGYCIWLPKDDTTPSGLSTLAHECLHVACHILDDCGVVYSDDAKEVLTYTFDDIFEYFVKILMKESK